MAGYLALVGRLGVPAFIPQEVSDGWIGIFAFVPAIVIGSIFAEVVSEWVDTEIYHLLIDRFRGKMQFMRVVLSNTVSLPLDSILFASLAFTLLPMLFGGNPLPWSALPSIILGQVVFKAIITVVSLPLIYAVPESEEHEERWLDEMFANEQQDDMGGEIGTMNVKAGDEI
jgi:uncharacterized integral membrane protein (TIGR00697 family)